MHRPRLLCFLLLPAAAVPRPAAALCECGYAARGPQAGDGPWLFTQALETDFTKLRDMAGSKDWVRQQFNVSAAAGRGKYGKAFGLDNVAARPKAAGLGNAPDAGPGLELRVGSELQDGAVPVAEVDSARQDLHWGSYRAGMRVTAVKGTCAAFFWYFNDTQEIDMEFLSQEYDADKQLYPVNLVVQSKQSQAAGYDARKTHNFEHVNLGFNPSDGFHEYRFDYLPGRVIFYADSTRLAEMKGDDVPSSAGHVILQHWSNGNPLWSGGPPAHDALLTVSYVKAYFNSSGGDDAEWARRCAAARSAVCAIADVTAGNASTGGGFLTGGGGGGEDSAAGAARGEGAAARLVAAVAVAAAAAVLVMMGQ